MILNADLEKAKARWEAWFDGTLKKGPIVSITAPLSKSRVTPFDVKQPDTIEERWTDAEYRARVVRNSIMSTWYGGDAVPSWFVNFGPGSVASYLGSRTEFADDTVWFNQFEDNSLENILRTIHYDENNRLWKIAQEMTKRVLEIAEGNFIVSFADIGGILDILASLRGSEPLLADLVDSPELVHKCADKIVDLWLRYFYELKAIMDAHGQHGYTCWMPCWSEKEWYTLQCDFSEMISPDMFKEFVVPRLEKEASTIGRSIYHWDGPGELPHLDHILSVEKVNAVQYVSVVPRDPPNESLHWLPYYRRIAESGRGVFIFTSDFDQTYELSQRMPAERLAFHIHAKSKDDAIAFLKRFDLE